MVKPLTRTNTSASPARAAKPPPKTGTLLTADVVQLALRSRFNPLRGLTPQLLSVHLDNFMLGFVAYAALVWDQIEKRDDVLRNVASKRKKALARYKRQSFQHEDSPDAQAHAQALDDFYDHITVVNALDENERGGFPLLVRQMMDAVGKYYAVHEIVWQPGELLTAELRFVPLWFFENRSGRLQFLKLPLGGANGEPLEEGGWMITKGDGIMEACSIAYIFKSMPLKDWVAYSDKYGTPGVLGKTNAAKGSEAGDALKAAVAAFGQNWSGVVYGADGTIKEPISLITASGEGALPFPPLVERMDRAMASLWRGSDLSTLSADNKGASVQQDESDILLEDDAAMISETLQLYIDRWVIWQKFGVRPLAYSRIVIPQSSNVDLDLKIDELLLKAGARLGERERLEYYGRPLIAPDDLPLHNPASVTERIQNVEQNAPAPTEDLPG
jgi:phage gp29-like protein